MQSINTSFMRVVRGILLVVFVVPTGTAFVNGCSDDSETACFDWPDPSRSDIDPKVCPSAEEAEAQYLTDYDVVGTGTLESGTCCYSATLKSEGCQSSPGTLISAKPTKDSRGE